MAYTLVQSASPASVATGTTLATTLTSVQSGNRVFVHTSYYDSNGGADCTLASSPSNTWTKLLSANFAPVTTDKIYEDLWTCVAGATGNLTITMTGASAQEKGIAAQEYSGLDSSAGSGCLDVSTTGTGQGNNTTNPSSGTTAATHAANQLCLSGVGDWGASATWTVSSGGIVKDATASTDADGITSHAMGHKTSASGATEVCVWTCGGATNSDIAWIAVIKLASGGAAVVKPPSPRSNQAVHRAAIW